MPKIVPQSERERRYDRWYEFTKLYHDAVRHEIDTTEIATTKSMADEAWAQYTDVVTNNLTDRFEGYENPQGPR